MVYNEPVDEIIKRNTKIQGVQMAQKRKKKNSKLLFNLKFILAVIALVVFFYAIEPRDVGDVKKLKADSIGETQIMLSWKEAAHADGYSLYQKEKNGTEDYRLIAQTDKDTTSHCAVNLKQATEYDFYVTAYRNLSTKEIRSEEPAYLSVCTLPQKQEVGYLNSLYEGELTAVWRDNAQADGYELEYVQGDNFKHAEALTFDGTDTCLKTIGELNIQKEYSVRVRSFKNTGAGKVYGEWSDAKSATISDKIIMPANIDPNKPMVALTFDDGPGYNEASDRILGIFEKYKAHATFFMVGTNAENNAGNLKRKVAAGCELGNHTYNHKHYGSDVTASDIQKCSDAIFKACGQRPTVFRSTGGNTVDSIRSECAAEGMPLVYWSIDTQDWKTKDAEKTYSAVIDHVKDGDIVLMHDIYIPTADAVERIVPELIKRGYQLVTVTELIQMKTEKNPVPGQQYVTAEKINNNTK